MTKESTMWKAFVALAIAFQATMTHGFVVSPSSWVGRHHQPAPPMFDGERQNKKELATTADIVGVETVEWGKTLHNNHWRPRQSLVRLGPKPVSSFFRKLPLLSGGLIAVVNLLDRYFIDEGHWRGTRVHVNNALVSLAVPWYFLTQRSSAGSILCKTTMIVGFLGLVLDNLINASGKYLGEGEKLKYLNKIRCVSHGMTIPLMFIPVIEAGMLSGLFPSSAARVTMRLAVALSAYETLDWLSFDTNDMAVVDNRKATKHSVRAIAGTLSYTSGKILKCLLPVAALNLFILAVGSALAKSGVPAGSWLLASVLVSFLSCSIQRPDIQLYGEPTMMALIWAAAASCVP